MPLRKGKENVGYNIKEETKAHPEMKQKQKIAIALRAAGVTKPKGPKKGGK